MQDSSNKHPGQMSPWFTGTCHALAICVGKPLIKFYTDLKLTFEFEVIAALGIDGLASFQLCMWMIVGGLDLKNKSTMSL